MMRFEWSAIHFAEHCVQHRFQFVKCQSIDVIEIGLSKFNRYYFQVERN